MRVDAVEIKNRYSSSRHQTKVVDLYKINGSFEIDYIFTAPKQ